MLSKQDTENQAEIGFERERRIKTQMQLRNQSIRESSILKASQNSSENRNLSFHNPRN
jgi:hypothetical protein